MENDCKGCSSISILTSCKGGVLPHIKSGDCPCLNCLVKGMCNQICEDFKRYKNKFYSD